MKDNLIYIQHILDAVYKIESFMGSVSEETFVNDDDLTQSAVIRQLEIMGEATKNTEESFKDKYPEIPWRDISDTRNKVIHDYFQVDYSLIWEIYKKDLPKLKKQLEKILRRG